MISEYLTVQQSIKQYSCYVKHLISGYCEEFQTNKVYQKRITTVLARLFEIESSNFKTFFNSEEDSIVSQFIHYLSEQGEIFHLGKGYYTLPPERTIQLPNGKFVAISSLEFSEDEMFLGLGQLKTHPMDINITYSEYLFRPKLDELISFYMRKLTSKHDIVPEEILVFSERGTYKSKKFDTLQDDDFYIIYFNRLIGRIIKPEKYFAQWKNREWYVTVIPKGLFIRTVQALKIRKRAYSAYRLIELGHDFVELKLQYNLPREENILLRLFAIPNEYRRPKSYITTNDHVENIRTILKLYQLKEEGE